METTKTTKQTATEPKRAEPGTGGSARFFRIVLGPKQRFETFRTQDVGKPGGIERVAGKRKNGSWGTQTWLVSKKEAHVEGNTLVPDTQDVKELFIHLGSKPRRVKADIFEAKDRPNVPERAKPTAAQKKAWAQNIKKAQAARRKKSS